MKHHIFFFLSLPIMYCLGSCKLSSRNSGQIIVVLNTSSVNLTDKAIIIKRTSLHTSQDLQYPLLVSQSGDTIPSQLDDLNGDHNWDELFFVINLKAKQQDTIHLNWIDANIKYPRRTSVRFGVRQQADSHVAPALSDTFYANQLPGVIGYQHYQTDGPTWENDKVAFRQYLDGRNSIDVFGKTVSYMTPDSVGIGRDGHTENNYSNMKEWGTDILAVANSAGIGGFSLMFKDSLPRLGITEKDSLNNVDSTIFNIVTLGPTRSIMKFNYINWKPLDRRYNIEQTTSIWPGMYAFNNSINFKDLKGDETMVVSLVNSNTDHPLTEMAVNDKWVALFTHDKQSVNKTWWLGLALILPKENYHGYLEAPKQGSLSAAYLAKLKVENNKPVKYFAVAAWELSNPGFKDSAYFKSYLANLVNQLTADVSIKIY